MYTRAAKLAKDQREIEHIALYEEGEGALVTCVVDTVVYLCLCTVESLSNLDSWGVVALLSRH